MSHMTQRVRSQERGLHVRSRRYMGWSCVGVCMAAAAPKGSYICLQGLYVCECMCVISV